MKKHILTLALMAVASSSSAGSAMDDLMEKIMGSDPSLSVDYREISSLGALETYAKFEMKNDDVYFVADTITIDPQENVYDIAIKDFALTVGREDTFGDNARFSIPKSLLSVDGDKVADALASTQSFPVELCASLREGFFFGVSNMSSKSKMTITSREAEFVEFSAKADDDLSLCVMDVTLKISHIFVQNRGNKVALGAVDMDFKTPMSGRLPDEATDDTYFMNASLRDLHVSEAGKELASTSRINLSTSVDAKTLIGLERTGYSDVMQYMFLNPYASDEDIFESVSIPAIWNAYREMEGQFDFEISDFKIDYGYASGLAERGTFLNFSTNVASEFKDGKIDLMKTFNGPDIADLEFNLKIGLGEVDETRSVSPEDFMMTAPVTFEGMTVTLKDNGIGEIAKSSGVDPYTMIPMMLMPQIGSEKADMISDWLASAKTDGAAFEAEPPVPLPALMVFAGLMGDWSVFADSLGVK